MHREAEYYEYSELASYSLPHDQVEYLTYKLRARDPDVSRDGKSVVFTVAHDQTTSVFVAPMTADHGKIQLGAPREIFPGHPYDATGTPKFTPDGRSVIFSVHRNGNVSEELMAVDLATLTAKTLVENGKFNRYPAVAKNGDIYFVSDQTGVDNLYVYREGRAPEQVSNLTTGAAFPSVDENGRLYAALFSATGWDLAEIEPPARPLVAEAGKIGPAPAPPSDHDSDAHPDGKTYVPQDYSLIPSIWPRAWIPYAAVTPGNFSFGESLAGYDATDRHRYALNLGYDTLSKKRGLVYPVPKPLLGAHLHAFGR